MAGTAPLTGDRLRPGKILGLWAVLAGSLLCIDGRWRLSIGYCHEPKREQQRQDVAFLVEEISFLSALLPAILLCWARSVEAQAPVSVAGHTFAAAVSNGIWPFSGWGYFMFIPADSGNSYQLVGAGGVASSHGTYAYSRTSSTTGTIALNDATAGPVQASFEFTTTGSGAYSLTSSQAPGASQNGTFLMFSSPVPTSLAGKTIDCTIQDGDGVFANRGSFVFAVSASGSTLPSRVTEPR